MEGQRLLENCYVMKVSQHSTTCKPDCNFSFKIVPFYEASNPTVVALLKNHGLLFCQKKAITKWLIYDSNSFDL